MNSPRRQRSEAPPQSYLVPTLSAVPSTLAIPLAARAWGGRRFPALDVHDGHAADALALLGDDGRRWLDDEVTVFGVLVRTALFREQARAFFARHPQGLGVSLGCGLADYFQWLDNGRNHWIDADLPEVVALRSRLALPECRRRRCRPVDLTDCDWWDRLGLASGPGAPPVLLICEGVLMYLQPEQVQALLRCFGERAPEGSQLVLDAMSWLAPGHAELNPSVRQTGAQFTWGLSRLAELTEPHPRLRLGWQYSVMEDYGFPYAQLGPLFRWFWGVPLYALYRIEAREAGLPH
ncbi:class I SAM-dependent methyltransferase [Caldimonas tepidiphila]|uniref:class I SAM-dependent methyltransferase n=1 Tax=Caldimonas tepidiphila TaxID=2315841 RepID=UPI000E5A1646|nr:class I SAM-dependent methyltransferase [Caldimonas tepidiphila]